MRRFLLFLAALPLFAGCVSVYEAHVLEGLAGRPGEQAKAYEVVTTGWFLFDCIPIVCGDPDGGAMWFSNTVNAQSNIAVIDRLIRRHKATRIGTLTSHETNEGILVIVLNRHSFRTSVTLFHEPEPTGLKFDR